MSDFATVNDVILLQRPLSNEETARATAIIPLICDALRYEAGKVGKDLDAMIANDPKLASVAKLVTTDITIRALRVSTTDEPMAQESQSALGYVWSGTTAVTGGGVANCIMKNDLKRLGIKRQRIGALEIYETSRNNSNITC